MCRNKKEQRQTQNFFFTIFQIFHIYESNEVYLLSERF
jgi:hypothetical protein